MKEFIYIPATLRSSDVDEVTASNAGFKLAGDDLDEGILLSAGLVNLHRSFAGLIDSVSANRIPAESLTDIVFFNRAKKDSDVVVGTKARFHHRASAWKSDKIKDQAIDTNFLNNSFKSDSMRGIDRHGGLSNVYDGLGLLGGKEVLLRKVSKKETDNAGPSRFLAGVTDRYQSVPYVPNAVARRYELENKFSENDLKYLIGALSLMGENYYMGEKFDKPLALTLKLINDRFGSAGAKAFALTARESKDSKYNYDGADDFSDFKGTVSLNLLLEKLSETRK